METKECPTCGREKQKGKHLICRECFQEYSETASDALVRGDVIYLSTWVRGAIAAKVPDLEKGLEILRDQYCSLRGKIKEEALSFIHRSLNGKKVATEVFYNAVDKKGKELWNDKGGNKLHYQVKSTEAKIEYLNGLLKEIATQ
jgi:hypothetical protein